MNKTKSFRTRLWLAFAAFAAVIFVLLWLLQTVFLQSFYDSMLIRNTRAAASEIAANSQSADIAERIDSMSRDNSLLVFLTDTDGTILYSSDAYKSYYHASGTQGGGDNPYHSGETMNWQVGSYRNLPDGYQEFLTALSRSSAGRTELRTDTQYVCGSFVSLADGSSAVLYVSATLGAVSGTASILRVQLLWVTVLSLALSFAIAWLLAKRFSVPVDQLSLKARALAGESESAEFQKGFCRELDALSDTLDQTADELREARDYQRELLANVSHDLRTPLTMIKGYAEMVRDISWEDEQQRTADTGVILREADRLTSLVNEILEYSSLQACAGAKNFIPLELGALVKRTAAQFEPLLAQNGGHIETEIDGDCVVNGDPALLERAAWNLIDNAVRHAGKDKTVIITVRKTDDVCFAVQDHGAGIDEAELPHIWERYYTSRQRGNTGVSGLGLAIVRQIAELHGAQVGVESRRGEGSRFWLTFPKP